MNMVNVFKYASAQCEIKVSAKVYLIRLKQNYQKKFLITLTVTVRFFMTNCTKFYVEKLIKSLVN